MTIKYIKWNKILAILFIAIFSIGIKFLKSKSNFIENFISMQWLFENTGRDIPKSVKHNHTITVNNLIKVKITGAVNNPGIYEIEAGKYLIELAERAGVKYYADLNGLEKVKLEDGCEYYIPVRKLKPGEKININRVDEEELLRIPIINRTLAKNIIEYRNKYGRFDSIEEVMEVEGIGPSKFNIIKNFIIIGD